MISCAAKLLLCGDAGTSAVWVNLAVDVHVVKHVANAAAQTTKATTVSRL
jgi:hypothetical protein